MYFARVRVAGKLIRQSLKTDVLSVAKLRLGDLEKAGRQGAESGSRLGKGRMSFGDALTVYRQRIDSNPKTKPRTKAYYHERIKALLKSWPGVEALDIRKLSKSDCLKWAGDFSRDSSATAYNNTVKILFDVIEICVEMGARYDNPAKNCAWVKPGLKKLALPSPKQFEQWINAVRASATPWAARAADTIQFLAFTGCRLNEARHVTWEDVDFPGGRITVRITKNSEARTIPMIADARALLERMRAERQDDPATAGVLPLHECQVTMDKAAEAIGMKRIMHHDLRHLFATCCIESGVDIPTVSRWLGHKDGGALAMKVYGHLRDYHSTAMAERVTFAQPKPENVIELKKEVAS